MSILKLVREESRFIPSSYVRAKLEKKFKGLRLEIIEDIFQEIYKKDIEALGGKSEEEVVERRRARWGSKTIPHDIYKTFWYFNEKYEDSIKKLVDEINNGKYQREEIKQKKIQQEHINEIHERYTKEN